MPLSDSESLRAEFDRRLCELDKRLTLRFEMNDKAGEIALTGLNHRLAQMNEIREAMRDQQGKFVTAAVYDERHKALENRLSVNDAALNNMQGRSTQTVLFISIGVTVVAIVAGLLSHLLWR